MCCFLFCLLKGRDGFYNTLHTSWKHLLRSHRRTKVLTPLLYCMVIIKSFIPYSFPWHLHYSLDTHILMQIRIKPDNMLSTCSDIALPQSTDSVNIFVQAYNFLHFLLSMCYTCICLGCSTRNPHCLTHAHVCKPSVLQWLQQCSPPFDIHVKDLPFCPFFSWFGPLIGGNRNCWPGNSTCQNQFIRCAESCRVIYVVVDLKGLIF